MIEYKCEMCGGIYESDRSNEEAHAEAEELFGNLDGDRAIVCDDCWNKMMDHFVQTN